jgi:hypothetical protein
MKEDFIEVYKKRVSDQLCDRLIFILDKYSEKNKGSGYFNAVHRQDFQLALDWCEENDECEQVNSVLVKALDEYLEKYRRLIGDIRCVSYRIKLQKTLIGGGFHIWHSEIGGGAESDRMLTWTIFLNDIPSGEGETEFLHYGKRIQPSKGDILIFPAFFTHTHRGNPPITTVKYIATGWWCYGL